MMLVTCAFDPPSWVAMLPQKFSAATTSMRPWLSALAPPPPHAAIATAPARQWR